MHACLRRYNIIPMTKGTLNRESCISLLPCGIVAKRAENTDKYSQVQTVNNPAMR